MRAVQFLLDPAVWWPLARPDAAWLFQYAAMLLLEDPGTGP